MSRHAKAQLARPSFQARAAWRLPFAISHLPLAIGQFCGGGLAWWQAWSTQQASLQCARHTAAMLALAAVMLLAGCRSPSSPHALHRFEFQHPAMGTLFTITLYAPDAPTAEAAAHAAFKRVDELEDIMSDFQADSELMRLCDQPYGKPVPVSADLFNVLQQSLKIAKLSDGAFDVTIGPCVRLWRFSRKRKALPTPAEIATAKAAVGWQKLRLDSRARTVTLLAPNMRLDLGGIGKGYAADAAMLILKGRGIDRALIAASGDIAVGDPPPGERGWRVGIATLGTRTNQIARTVLLHNAGISTSGDSEQFIEIGGVRYSHILNPATGLGLTNRIQATIIGPNAISTDSLDTTVSILGVKRGLALADALPGTAALILTRDDGHEQTFTSSRYKRLAHPAN
jgi:thiamine biosynthesis lipoprotein